MSTWVIAPIKTPKLIWGERRGTTVHQCLFCGLLLLTGERPGFCCGKNGQYLHDITPLPPLPIQYSAFISHPQISSLSRILNLIFSFASLETTHQFPQINGPPGFFSPYKAVYIIVYDPTTPTPLFVGFYMMVSCAIKFPILNGPL